MVSVPLIITEFVSFSVNSPFIVSVPPFIIPSYILISSLAITPYVLPCMTGVVLLYTSLNCKGSKVKTMAPNCSFQILD